MTAALVTGAGGFLARHLAVALRRRGAGRIVGADIDPRASDGFDEWHETDFTDVRAVRELVEVVAPDSVFHLVGAFRGDAAELLESNAGTAGNLLQALHTRNSAARVVLVGSAAEYGKVLPALQPVREHVVGDLPSAYGLAKREVSALAARAAREWRSRVVVARPFNVVGAGIPHTLVVGAIVRRLRAALAGSPPRTMRIGTVTSVRDFVAAEDVAEGLVLALERGRSGEAYNLCSGTGHSIAEVLARLVALAPGPVTAVREEGLVRPAEVGELVGSWEKAGRELGWSPSIPLERSLRTTWDATAPEGVAR